MYTLLADNPAHLEQLCDRFGLGQVKEPVSSLGGGFHHKVWKLVTQDEQYVVKQLAADTDLSDKTVPAHFNVTEAIASKFNECGIAAIHALIHEQHYLQQIDKEAYLIYPWTDAVALDGGKVSKMHALKVARVLAQMHTADIDVAGAESELSEPSDKQDVAKMLNESSGSASEVAAMLKENRSFLKRVAVRYQTSLPLLECRQVISHGDLDQKNVLWDNDEKPVIIDWESAHRMNPTREIIHLALDWSGIGAKFDSALPSRIVSAYVTAGGKITPDLVEVALHRIMGEWLDWLMYNVGRDANLDDPELRALGKEQVEVALSVMQKLEGLRPDTLCNARAG